MDIPGYRLGGPIGFGAQGEVRLGRSQDGRTVAIRVFEPELHPAEPDLPTRLRRLMQVTSEYVVRTIEVIPLDDGGCGVVSEAIAGPTLATVRAARHHLSLAEACGVGADLSAGLRALHDAGITHGDVAPANVVLTTRGERRIPVLVDVGTEPSLIAGTPGFAAPEAETGAAGPPADVYSLARLLLWLVDPGEQAELAALLGTALEADPARRPTATAVREALLRAERAQVQLPDARNLAALSLRERATREPTRTLRDRKPRHRRDRSRRWLVVAAAIVALPIAAAGIYTGISAGVANPKLSGAAEHPEEAVTTNDQAATDEENLIGVVDDLTAARDEALNTADAGALRSLSAAGSPAASGDADLIRQVDSGRLRAQGMSTSMTDAQVLPDSATAYRSVQAVLESGEHIVQQGTDTRPQGGTSRCVVIDVVNSAGQWQVWNVRDC